MALLRKCGLSLLEAKRFNNKGFYMCKYYVFIKVWHVRREGVLQRGRRGVAHKPTPALLAACYS